MSEHDIYLNGTGYMLAKNVQGQLQSGAAREQVVDPFTHFVSATAKYTKVAFRFGDGAGLAEYDGSHRYESATFADTRSGRAIHAPRRHYTSAGVPAGTNYCILDPTKVEDEEIKTGAQEAIGNQFLVPAGKTAIRTVHVLVRRNPAYNYESASGITVGIQADSSGKPAGSWLASATINLKNDPQVWLPWPDRWRTGEYFWIEVTFSADCSVTPLSLYWICVANVQALPVYWGEDRYYGQIDTRSHYTSGAWVNGYSDYRMLFKLRYHDESDGWARCFCEFGGTDGIKRMYAGVRNKVMYFIEGTETWALSKQLDFTVLQLLVFNKMMFAAQGPDQDLWYTDGATPTTTWTQVTGHQANALAIHDSLLWKADVASVGGSTTGTAWTAAAVEVGDPGTPVFALVSHGGKLFAAKAEGIFEISYPETYPTSGNPKANLMLDFRTELAPRPFLLDWHSGLYFPSYAGIYELKNSILRNLWTERIDEGALEVAGPVAFQVLGGDPGYTIPRRWGPLYDARPGTITCAAPTTRGIWFGYSDPHLQMGDIWCYDGKNWHQCGPAGEYSEGGGGEFGEYVLAVYLQDIGGGRGRLWIGSGIDIYYWRMPTWTNARNQDPWCDYTYTTSPKPDARANIYTPRLTLADKSTSLLFCKVGVFGTIGEAGNAIFIYYKVDDAASWTELGFIMGSPGVVYNEKSFPAGISGRTIQLRLMLCIENLKTISPILHEVVLMYQPIPEDIDTHQLTIRAASRIPLRTGGEDPRTGAEVLSGLRALFDLGAPFAYVDPAGASHNVRATGMTVQHMRQEQQPGATLPTEAYAILTLLEV